MAITIGTLTFDHVGYDTDSDVLYLSVGEPREPADSYYGTTEGHNVRYDDSGQAIALTLVNTKWLPALARYIDLSERTLEPSHQ